MIDIIGFNSGVRTRAYLEYSTILIGQKVMRGEVLDHILILNPDPQTLYFMTKFITDEELNFINQMRTQAGYKDQNGNPYKPLPRLAYIGDGKYQTVMNQAQRKAVERAKFSQDQKQENRANPVNMVQNKNLKNKAVNYDPAFFR